MAITYPYRVTGDFSRMIYSQHRTREAAERAAKRLAKEWGWSHPGSEPLVEVLTDTGWHECGNGAGAEMTDTDN